MSDNMGWVGPVMGAVVVGSVANTMLSRTGTSGGVFPSVNEGRGKAAVVYQGKRYKRYRAGTSPWDRVDNTFSCQCGLTPGGYHKLGCELEQCPICKGQLLKCGHIGLFK